MVYVGSYAAEAPERAQIDARSGPLVLEFGTDWCGYCQAAQPSIRAVLESRADVAHIKIEDGKGRRLGRSYAVKLWPTLVFLRDGIEVARVVRPTSSGQISEALESTSP